MVRCMLQAQVGLHCIRADIENRRNFRSGKSFTGTQVQNLALTLGQCLHGFQRPAKIILVVHFLLGRLFAAGNLLRQGPRPTDGQLSAPHLVAPQVRSDAEEPYLRRLRMTQQLVTSPRAQKRFLRKVLGGVWITRQPQRKAIDTRNILLQQLSHWTSVALVHGQRASGMGAGCLRWAGRRYLTVIDEPSAKTSKGC